jgi:NTP pyrophosphatase (non-canonical NTP hydrolase)
VNQLEEMQAEVAKVNVANGWYEKKRTVGDDIALLHSEVSEMLEAYRQWGFYDPTAPATHDGSDWIQSKPEGFDSEAADVLIRLLDMAHRYDIDLAFEFDRKLAYNKTRGYRHGGKRL